MQLIPESSDLTDYLKELDVVDYSHPLIQKKVDEIFVNELSEIEKVKVAFEFVRDKVSHSWDIQSKRVTCKASEVLEYQEGICYAKSNLLAALLRSEGIPTGFCYQRLMIFDTPEEGYSLHTLNGVFLNSLNRWIRLDARGNKPGVQAEFSVNEEILAFPIRKEFDEKDYPIIYTNPNHKTITTLEANTDALEMYIHHLPDVL
ncbi:transglutaminase family protein [Peribacillus frigoritolerans]|uniref:transglutaminase-like domain-containing protein n=1 Tax=Peribacillus frigoritolerans TaxID=450367 RepID=UPI00207A791F|nr:transglutaminase family protein [Peribacillus frigoritolerans]USK80753.1 transglutaminase family protein [Peribacillus frigoritolerans]WJE48025.1 transglutaminase family protein [Peribacillus frigoritolerans]